MGASLHFQVLRDPNHEDFQKHAAVNQACLDAGIKKLPEETAAYLKIEYPECLSEIEDRTLQICDSHSKHKAISKLESDHRYGYVIDITQLPPDAKIIRVYMS